MKATTSNTYRWLYGVDLENTPHDFYRYVVCGAHFVPSWDSTRHNPTWVMIHDGDIDHLDKMGMCWDKKKYIEFRTVMNLDRLGT